MEKINLTSVDSYGYVKGKKKSIYGQQVII